MSKANMIHTVLLLLLFLPVKAVASPQSFSEAQLSTDGRKAFRTLLEAERFEDKFIGEAAEPSKLVEAYCTLLREPAADAAFKNLLENATLAGQLYALCGLYFTDPIFLRSVVEKYRHSEEKVDTLSGCISGLRPVSMLVESKNPIIIDVSNPEQSLDKYIEMNTRLITGWNGRKKKRKGERPPAGYQIDILNGGYSVWFKCKG